MADKKCAHCEMSSETDVIRAPLSLDVLPQELQERIIDVLSPVDVKRFMQICRAARALGKRAMVWTTVREAQRLPPPKKRATKYKTDYDIVTRDMCRLCWKLPSGDHNICYMCLWEKIGKRRSYQR